MDEMILDLIDYGVEDEFDEDEENNLFLQSRWSA